jgi:signal transduction histidine kinase
MVLGGLLFLTAVVHHTTEFYTLDESVGPLVAVVLDGLPALVLVYAGYRLSDTDLPHGSRLRVLGWCLVGATLFGAVMALSLAVRAFEGRAVGEAIFPLLLATEAGGIAGVVAGYSTVRLRTEARRVREVNTALGFVNSLIRHDLRNDLNVIQGRVDLLAEEHDVSDTESASVLAEKTDEALARIETTGVVAETLVGNPELEAVDLVAITAEITAQLKNTYGLSVTTEFPDQAFVTANVGLRSVVDNILENAVEHNDAEEPRVHVAVETDSKTARLSVTDNGPGVPDSEKETLRNPRREGAGGGISLVGTLVDAYGGDVRVGDNDPRGTVVTVQLPRSDTRQP